MKTKKFLKKKKTKSKTKSSKDVDFKDGKKKLPKSFYDDGLGDMLDWIEDEILQPSELKNLKKRSADNEETAAKKKLNKKVKLYGDNEVNPDSIMVPPRKVRSMTLDSDEEDSISKKPPEKGLSDKARGLINRLTAQTMPFVASEFEKLYSKYPRHDVDATLFSHIESSIIIGSVITKRKLVAEMMLLVAYLSHSVSNGIGANLVHLLFKRFEKLYSDESISDKRMENVLNCLAHLHIIGLISSKVIFELSTRINAGPFRAKSVELITFLLRGVGFHLRKDPTPMRKLILAAQENCTSLQEDSGEEVESRIKFMIEALTAIKNNNVNKLENYGCDIDTETIETTLKNLIHKSHLPEPLSDASYHEICNSSNWYLLETRLDDDDQTGKDKKNKNDDEDSSQALVAGNKLSKLEETICRHLKLNKPAEKSIFSALSKATDYTEACTLILSYGMARCSDAMTVCVQAAIHEKKYNPFYYNIINNLCKHNRRYKMATKFAIQDRMKQLSSMNQKKVDIFKRLTFELVKSDAIPITILKAIEWANINESTKSYLIYLFDQISSMPNEELVEIMRKIDKKSDYAAEMRNFCSCFMEECELFG